MTDSPSPPPARERTRTGIRHFLAETPPSADEALIDRLAIKLSGHVRAVGVGDVQAYASEISTSSASASLDHTYRVLGAGNWAGSRFRVPVVKQTSIASGEVLLFGKGSGARVEISLALNPMRTLGHLLDRYSLDEIEALSASDFFALRDGPAALNRTLDRSDNAVFDFLTLGGTIHRAQVAAVERYLRAFERALKDMLIDQLCPPERGFVLDEHQGDVLAVNEHFEVRLGWSGVAVTQCEVCWERQSDEALPVVRRFADGALAAARNVEVGVHGEPEPDDGLDWSGLGRDGSALSVRSRLVPSGSILLAVYAKMADRIRVEVRYQKDIPQAVRKARRGHAEPLYDWFAALRADALKRLPWAALRRLSDERRAPSVTDLLDLIDEIVAVTSGHPESRRAILESLFVTSGISITDDEGPIPVTLADKLVRRGILEHVRLRPKDPGQGRRLRLAPRFMGLRWPPPPCEGSPTSV